MECHSESRTGHSIFADVADFFTGHHEEVAATPAKLPVLDKTMPLSVIVFGATGDLAKKKLFPAIYQLMLLEHFPRNVNIVGYGRKEVEMKAFIAKQCSVVKEDARLPFAEYVARISFHGGPYDSPESFEKLDVKLKQFEAGKPGNRLYFLSVPPTIFGDVTKMISTKSRATEPGFTHCIIEKPFGRDTKTYLELDQLTSSLFKESELYRIDHYLGKEVVLNLMSLRFANQIFEPIWNNKHIEGVEITFKEDLGTGGRGGYFDKFGIIRDIMQNHLLQVFMFLGMEPPSNTGPAALIRAKVDLLKAVKTLHYDPSQCFLGQFTGNSWKVGGETHSEPGYQEDPTVPEGSNCPTFAAVMLEINNKRWNGVPFIMKAGKGLDERMAEVRIRFKPQAYNKMMATYQDSGQVQGNELVLRIQPDEACYLKTFSKEPGLGQNIKPTVMDMQYATQFKGAYVGDAYERMFLNAAKGDGGLFVSSPELVEAWRIFTPLLHEIDEQKPDVVRYPFGSVYPKGFGEWSEAKGIKQYQDISMTFGNHDTEKLTSMFHELDADKSGTLSYDELTNLVRKFYDGREPTKKKVSQIMSRMDCDNDGSVTLDEFLAAASIMKTAFGASEEPSSFGSGSK